ncbi:MAG: BRO-N domain-containing protein [Limisphaerales bacterium]
MNTQDPIQNKMTNLFAFNDMAVRVMGTSEKPFFVATDICRALEIENPSDTVAKCVEEDDVAKFEVIDAMGRPQLTNVVNEGGMYSLIFRSNKPKAVPFRRWVCSEVLPAIRKTGQYLMDRAAKDRDALLYALPRAKGQTAQLAILNALGYDAVNLSEAKAMEMGVKFPAEPLPAELAEELTGLLIDAVQTWKADFNGGCIQYRHPTLPEAQPGFVVLRNMKRLILRVGGGLLLPHLQASDLASPELRELPVHQLTLALREVKRLLSQDPDLEIHVCRVNGRNARVLNIPLDDPKMIEALGATSC